VEWATPLVRIGGEIAASEEPEVEPAPEGVEVVQAPMVGTLYLQNRPGEPRYAPEGSMVERAQTLALVEVMKTLTPVKAPCGGCLVRWLVEDGMSVSQGEPLAWIEV
jgi:acetyl-CoA carboxylase biotin carboxyl carrier protein